MKFNSIKRFLSLPIVTVGIILLAILVRIFFQLYFFNANNDKTFQILAAQNFLSGKGFSLLEVFANDLSNSRYIPLIKWPPGYSLLLTPFLAICKNNVMLATLLLDAITCILFIFFARKLLLKTLLPVWLANIYTLVAGFFLYSFCLSSSTDFLSLTIYIIAIYFSLKLAEDTSFKLGPLILLSILLFLTAFIRYLYLPVAFVIPVSFSIFGLLKKNKILFRKGVVSFFLTLGLISFYLILQSSLGESAVYVRTGEKGFFLEPIFQMQPFAFSSFFNLEYFHFKLLSLTGLSFDITATILNVLHYSLLFLLLILFTNWVAKKKFLQSTSVSLYVFIGSLSSLVTIAVLVYLSVLHTPFKAIDNNKWTYVHENRYYAFPIFFLQQFLFVYAYHFRYSIKKWAKVFIMFCFIVLLIDMGHNIYFTFNSLGKLSKKLKNTIPETGLSVYINQITKKVTLENPSKNIVVFTQPDFLGAQIGFYNNVPALYLQDLFSDINIKATKDVLVLFITNNLNNVPFKFEVNTTKRIIANYNDFTFYTIDVKPD